MVLEVYGIDTDKSPINTNGPSTTAIFLACASLSPSPSISICTSVGPIPKAPKGNRIEQFFPEGRFKESYRISQGQGKCGGSS